MKSHIPQVTTFCEFSQKNIFTLAIYILVDAPRYIFGRWCRVSQLCRYAGCVRADLLFFPFGGKDQHAWHFSTCGHVRISAQNSHVVGLVKILCRPVFFSEHFGTLPPEVIFTSISSDPTFHHWSLFLCQCSRLPVCNHPPLPR